MVASYVNNAKTPSGLAEIEVGDTLHTRLDCEARTLSFAGAGVGCAVSMRPMDWTVTLFMALTFAMVAATIIACCSAPDDAAWARVVMIDP